MSWRRKIQEKIEEVGVGFFSSAQEVNFGTVRASKDGATASQLPHKRFSSGLPGPRSREGFLRDPVEFSFRGRQPTAAIW